MTLRLATFSKSGADGPRVGALLEGGILDLHAAAAQSLGALPGPWANSLVAVLSQPQWVEWAKQVVEEVGDEQVLPTSEVQLLPPVCQPGKLFLLAGNYHEHILETTTFDFHHEGEKLTQGTPQVFMKPSTDTIIGDGEPIILAKNSRFVDYEAELAVIIGQTGRHIPVGQALDYVAGITALNDVSEREWGSGDPDQKSEREKYFDWLNGKWFDTFAPMGPCAVPMADVPDVHDLRLRLYLNNELKQDASTGQMIFSVAETVSYISSITTLRPGDVIATGTPAGVGHPQGVQLQDRDIVQIELELVGTLTNPVQAEA